MTLLKSFLATHTNLKRLTLVAALTLTQVGCGFMHAVRNTEEGAGGEAMRVFDEWIESDGDIAAATTWKRKVLDGVTVAEVEQALNSVAVEENIKQVGTLPLSKELEARSGKPERFLKIYSYCSPATARKMIDFSPAMAAYLPCRITILEKDDGLWLYTLNMDMLIKMGRKLPPELKEDVMQVRQTLWKMLDRGSKGEF